MDKTVMGRLSNKLLSNNSLLTYIYIFDKIVIVQWKEALC